MLLTYRNTYKSLDDLNQDELLLSDFRINPITTISSAVTYMNNLKRCELKNSNEMQVARFPENPRISNIA